MAQLMGPLKAGGARSSRARRPMNFSLVTSRARREFKMMLGHTNHFVITILVGLDAVGDGTATISDDFSTSWSPHDSARSAARSREFALKASLAWTIDAVDTYLCLARRAPTILDRETSKNYDSAKSLGERVAIVAAASAQTKVIAPHLLSVAITWRNRLVHSTAGNEVAKSSREFLLKHADGVAAQFRGLDMGLVFEALRPDHPGVRSPSFKEVASFVHAAHLFVSEADKVMLWRLTPREHLIDVLAVYVQIDPQSRIQNVWGKTPERAMATIRELAREAGMTPIEFGEFGKTDDGGAHLLRDKDIYEVANWTPRQAKFELLTR